MVDTVEATASIEELDITPNPSESVSHLEQKQEHGFSAEQLRADIDFAKLKQTTQEKLEEQGLPAIVPEPNSKKVVMGQMEQILAEVFHYKTIQQYKDKIKPEFIALFNEAEQAMLLELIELLDQYLVLQKEYVTELLQLLGYKDSDAFFADIATIPAVASAMEAKKAFLVAIPEAHANYSDLDVAAKVATVIGPCRMFIIPHLMQRVQEEGPVDPNVPNKISMPYLELVQQATAALADSDLPVELFARAHRLDAMELCYLQDKSQRHAEKRAAFARLKDYSSDHRFSTIFVKFFTNERIDGLSNIAKSLSDEWMLDTDMGEKVSAPKYITDIRFNATKASITINEAERQMSSRPIELPQDEAEILEEKKVKSRRTRRFTQRFTQMFSRSPVSAESAEPDALSTKSESVSPAIVPELKVTTAARVDVSSSSMPELKVTQAAEKPDVSALSMPELKVTQATEKPDVSASSKPELKRSASEPQLKKTQLTRTSSIEKLSKVLGEVAQITATKLESVKDTINRFTGKSAKLSAAISFSDYVGTALHSVQIFQGIAKDQAAEAKADRAKFENWEFTYKRKANPQVNEKEEPFEGDIPMDSRDGDHAEIRHNGNLVCDVVAQKMPGDADNVASGVAVTVHRHEEEDIDLAVHMMVQALAKVGKKKIIITADLNSPEGCELALRYVKAILRQRAIPVLFDDDRELSAKETKAKIEELNSAMKDKSIYQHTAEQYEVIAKEIMKDQKEDAIFIKAFDRLMEIPLTTRSLFMKDPNPPRDTLNIMEIVNRLGDIALLRKNLAIDDYVDKMVDCLQKIHSNEYTILMSDDLSVVKREVKDYFAREIAEKPDILDRSPKSLMAEIFDFSLRKLQDRLFLNAFDNLLQDIATFSDVAIKMQDPNTGDALDAHQILTRLAQIAFVRKAMDEETFIDKVLAFGLTTLASSEQVGVTDPHIEDLKKELREKIRLHLLHPVADRDEAVFAADLIKFAQHALTPGHIAEDSKIYGVFAEKKSSCAASVRKEKEEVISPQPAQVMVR